MSVEFVETKEHNCKKCCYGDNTECNHPNSNGELDCDKTNGCYKYIETPNPTTEYTPSGKYETAITGYCGNTAWIDYYTIFQAFNVDPVLANAVKKLLGGGKRGYKTQKQDIEEAIVCFQKWLKLNGGLND